MKLIRKTIERDSSGAVTIMCEGAEDMWHVYNLVQVGDSLRAPALRKVQTQSSTGTVISNKVRTTLSIKVEKFDYDVQNSELHIAGRVIEENEYVKMGSYHTLDLELNRNFRIGKHEWDSVALERIEDACNPTKQSDIGAVVLEEGLANVCLITEYLTVVRQRIEVNIARKGRGTTTSHLKSMERFYETVFTSMQRNMNLESLKVIIIASPGFVAAGLRD